MIFNSSKDSGEFEIRIITSANNRIFTNSPDSNLTPTPLVLILELNTDI